MSSCFCSYSWVSCSKSYIKPAWDPLFLSSPSMTFLLPRAPDEPGYPSYFWASVGWVWNRGSKGSLGKGWNFNLTLAFVIIFFFLLTKLSADRASIILSWTFYIEMSLILIEGNGSFQFFVHVFSHFTNSPSDMCNLCFYTFCEVFHFVLFFLYF